jgi:hypothetical protein
MEDVQTTILTVGVVVGFTALLTWFSWRKRAASWAGVVTEISAKQVQRNRQEEDEAPLYEEFIVIRYRTDEGKKGKLTLPGHGYEKFFPGLAVGDRLVKEAGQDLPGRVD